MRSLNENEILSRYIYSKSQYRSSDHTAKHSAFMPPKDGRLSVFRTSGIAESKIWDIGHSLRPQPALGRADITVATVLGVELSVDPDDTPPRHANIVGWPGDRSATLQKAVILAEKSDLRLIPN